MGAEEGKINSYGGAVGTTCEYDTEIKQMGLFYCYKFL